MGGRDGGEGLGGLLLEKQLALFGDFQTEHRPLTGGVQLTVLLHQPFQPVVGLIHGEILVEGLGLGELFQLQHRLSLDFHGTGGDFFVFSATGIAHRQTDEGQRQYFFQSLTDGFHLAHASTSPIKVSPSTPVIFTGRI